jgi:hypothetical protein
MMKHLVGFFLVTLAFPALGAEMGCKEKRKAMHKQRAEQRQCNKAWQDSLRGNAPDPVDDCVAKQTAYVDAMKAYKACLRESKIVK